MENNLKRAYTAAQYPYIYTGTYNICRHIEYYTCTGDERRNDYDDDCRAAMIRLRLYIACI